MTPDFTTGAPGTGTEFGVALGALLASGSAYLATLSDWDFFTPQDPAWSPAGHARHLQSSAAPLALALRLPRWILGLRFGHHAGASRTLLRLLHPILGLLTVREMLAFSAYHTSHHLRRNAERAGRGVETGGD